jgi:hypothetical protein
MTLLLRLSAIPSYSLCKVPGRLEFQCTRNVRTVRGYCGYLILQSCTVKYDPHGWREGRYLVNGTGVSVEQHAEGILQDCSRLGLSKRVLPAFNGFAQKRLRDICAVASCQSGCRVRHAQQVHIRQEPVGSILRNKSGAMEGGLTVSHL